MHMNRSRERTDIFDNRAYREERMFSVEGTEVSTSVYNLIIGAMLLWGLFVDFMISHFLGSYMYGMNYIVLIILYFVMTLGGTCPSGASLASPIQVKKMGKRYPNRLPALQRKLWME